MKKNLFGVKAMAASLIAVIAATFILCLAELPSAGKWILALLDAAAAIVFSLCPFAMVRAEQQAAEEMPPDSCEELKEAA